MKIDILHPLSRYICRLYYNILRSYICLFKDGLKKRMESLKRRVEEATAAVEGERKRNVELLNLVFPPDVARQLWRGNIPILTVVLRVDIVYFQVLDTYMYTYI